MRAVVYSGKIDLRHVAVGSHAIMVDRGHAIRLMKSAGPNVTLAWPLSCKAVALIFSLSVYS